MANPQEISEALAKMLKPDGLERYPADAVRGHVVERFSISAMIAGYRALYSSVAGVE